MAISFDTFVGAFLGKITEYEFVNLTDTERTEIVDGYLARALSSFRPICQYDLFTTANKAERVFNITIPEADLDEIVDIVSDGMVVQWLKPYVYKQEILENTLNTRDFSTYSPAELLLRIGNAYKDAQKGFTQRMREYSYDKGDLTRLHL